MKKIIIAALTLIFCQALIAQKPKPFSVSKNQIFFSDTLTEFQTDSLPLTIYNTYHTNLSVKLTFFGIYQDTAFRCSSDSIFIPYQDSSTIYIRFSPKQNIHYQTAMILSSHDLLGWEHSIGIPLEGKGKFSNSYYDSTFQLEGDSLKLALRRKMSSQYRTLSYNTARDSMFMMIDNWKTNGKGATNNTLECVYTGRQIVGYTNRTAAQNAPNDFNTEHTFPQSFFSSMSPMVSDLNHLFPTDNTANSQRGNFPFGVVLGNPTWSNGGSKLGNGIFEPRDIHKSRVARAMMYFGIMYGANPNVQISFLTPQEPVFRSWMLQFPPDSTDIKRNEDIYRIQGNRNPLIDYPQLLNRMGVISQNSDLLKRKDYWISATTTASQSSNMIHSFVVYNSGNQPLSFGGVHSYIPSAQIQFIHPFDTVIAPHSFTEIQFTWNGAVDSLVFPTDKSSNDLCVIHLSSGMSIRQIPQSSIILKNQIEQWQLTIPNITGSFRLIDVQGKTIKEGSWKDGELEISKQDIPSGIYFFIPFEQKNIGSLKLIR
jgi:hypothetical protein